MNILKNIAVTLALVTGACGVEPAIGTESSDVRCNPGQCGGDGGGETYTQQLASTWGYAYDHADVLAEVSGHCSRVSSVRVVCTATITTPVGNARVTCEFGAITGTSCTVT